VSAKANADTVAVVPPRRPWTREAFAQSVVVRDACAQLAMRARVRLAEFEVVHAACAEPETRPVEGSAATLIQPRRIAA
jgi:hypothetical protein